MRVVFWRRGVACCCRKIHPEEPGQQAKLTQQTNQARLLHSKLRGEIKVSLSQFDDHDEKSRCEPQQATACGGLEGEIKELLGSPVERCGGKFKQFGPQSVSKRLDVSCGCRTHMNFWTRIDVRIEPQGHGAAKNNQGAEFRRGAKLIGSGVYLRGQQFEPR